ncbi:39255_t:CDS:2 [Gigaspora margarita]|uniref:39255_t:CDS:1 n=1 Tax=Gigaspora margarita TaxID=4874 RepID=A0ABN7VG00_GIGMA|nr:39255_t:CDS:2 [Gigaspora margarita]
MTSSSYSPPRILQERRKSSLEIDGNSRSNALLSPPLTFSSPLARHVTMPQLPSTHKITLEQRRASANEAIFESPHLESKKQNLWKQKKNLTKFDRVDNTDISRATSTNIPISNAPIFNIPISTYPSQRTHLNVPIFNVPALVLTDEAFFNPKWLESVRQELYEEFLKQRNLIGKDFKSRNY